MCILAGHSTWCLFDLVDKMRRDAAAPRLTKRKAKRYTAFARSLSSLQAVFDTPDDIASGTTEEGLLPPSEGCPWIDLTGLACHLTRTYKGLSRRLILMPTYRCSVHAEVVLAFVQRDGS